jgi:D-inositol-3-phosphate glycosyltransferase
VFGKRRQFEQRIAETRSTMEHLEQRLREVAEAVEGLRAERAQDSHAVRSAATKADVALRRADEVAADQPGRVEGLAAELSRLEQSIAEELETLSARLRHVVGEISPAQLVGGGLDGGPDHPPAVVGEPVAVHGWALVEPGAVASVEVTVDGRPVEEVQFALPRTDVQSAFSQPDASTSGFNAFVEVPQDASGKLLVDAVAVASDRSRSRIGTAALPLISRDSDDLSEPRPLERIRPSRLGGSLRPVFFAHSLDYGGAELRMLDLLTGLAEQQGFEALVVSGRAGPLSEELKELGAQVHLTRGWGVGGVDAYEAWHQEVGGLVRNWNPTAAVAVTLASFAGVDLAGRLGVPCAWSIHETAPLPLFLAFGFPFEDRVHRYAASRAAAAFETADALVFEAEASRQAYSAYGGDKRAVVIRPGIDLSAIADYRRRTDRSQARDELDLDHESTVLLCVGVLQPRKAQTLLVQAFRELAPRHPMLLLALVGDRGGSYADALRELTSRSGLEDRIRVVPADRDILPWFAAADLFVNSSFEETVPGVILEAAAFELPVLSTAVGGIPELIEDSVSGFLCAPKDLTALVDGLERLVATTDEQRRRLTSEASARVNERHDVRDRNRKLEELLRSLAEGSARRPSVVKT